MTRRFSVRAALAIFAAALACFASGVCAQAKSTLVWGTSQAPRHLNPAVQSGIATMMPGAQIFASPLRFDDKWNAQPYLAESWSFQDDGLSLLLKLVPKPRSGRPVTSEDIAFSIMTIRQTTVLVDARGGGPGGHARSAGGGDHMKPLHGDPVCVSPPVPDHPSTCSAAAPIRITEEQRAGRLGPLQIRRVQAGQHIIWTRPGSS